MKKIPLTQGKEALIDDEDFERLSKYRWFAVRKGSTGDLWYAATQVPGKTRKQEILYIHHLILSKRVGLLTDHRDQNGLNNQKKNLRYCTRMQNRINCRKTLSSSSQFRGVSWHKRVRKWAAVIRHDKKLYHLGYFESEVTAAKEYDRKVLELRGSINAKLNFQGGIDL